MQHSMHSRYTEGQSCGFVFFFTFGNSPRVSSAATFDTLGKSVIEDNYFSQYVHFDIFPEAAWTLHF